MIKNKLIAGLSALLLIGSHLIYGNYMLENQKFTLLFAKDGKYIAPLQSKQVMK